jgi:GNAT superfamily N-acetyltransferase
MFVSFALESWDQFYADAKPLIEKHFEEAALVDLELGLDEEFFQSMFSRGSLMIMTARDDGKLVGYLLLSLVSHPISKSIMQLMEYAFYLTPEYRKGWTAAKMIRATEQIARVKNAGRVVFAELVREGYTGPGKLYERLGYKLSSRYYSKSLEV